MPQDTRRGDHPSTPIDRRAPGRPPAMEVERSWLGVESAQEDARGPDAVGGAEERQEGAAVVGVQAHVVAQEVAAGEGGGPDVEGRRDLGLLVPGGGVGAVFAG